MVLNKPLVLIAGSFLAGLYVGVERKPLWLVVTLLVIILAIWFHRAKVDKVNLLLVMAVVYFTGIIYFQLWSTLTIPQLDPSLNGSPLQGTAVIISEPQVANPQTSLIARLQQSSLSSLNGRKISLKIKDLPAGTLRYGQEIKFAGVLIIPAKALNPGEFDYQQYLRQQGIAGLVIVSAPKQVVVRNEKSGNWLVKAILRIKGQLASVINLALKPEEATVLAGIILGDRADIATDVLANFRYLGIVHILSVSGLQVGLILLGLQSLTKTLGLAKTPSLWLTLTGIGFYMLITGLAAPVTRAGLMAVVALIGRHQLRNKDWCSAMALAALVLVIIQPTVILAPGFQLSFAATWSILYLGPLINALLEQVTGSKWLKKLTSIPLAAQIGTLPLIAYHFHSISLLALVGNVFLVWLVIPVTLLGMLGAIVGTLSYLPGKLILQVAGFFTQILVMGANYLAQLPGGNFHVSSPSGLEILAWYGFLVALVLFYRHGGVRILVRGWLWRKEALVVYLCLLLAGTTVLWTMLRPTNLSVTFLAVGQGDAAVIQTPDQRVWLVDVGGTSPGGERRDPGEQVVVPYLSQLGINHIAGIILTHPDSDHINGLSAVLDNFSIEQVLVSPWFGFEPLGRATLKLLREKQIPIQLLTQGQQFDLGKHISMQVFNPQAEERGQSYTDSNNSSIVLKLIDKQRSFLFTGDAEVKALEEIAQKEQIRADVVKIPHHGSRSTFSLAAYQAMGAQYAVLSVGKNFFGHPHPEVTKYLTAHATQVWRTDRDGAITIKTDGSKMWLTSLKGDRGSGL